MNTIHLEDRLTDGLTPCSRVLLENLTSPPLVKKFCRTLKFITAFTSARHLSLSARSILEQRY